MDCKAKGSRNERRSRKILESQGYEVLKAGASLGVFDLVGIGAEDIVLVQVKTNSWPSRKEVVRMEVTQCPPNCRKVIHRWRDRVELPDIKLVITVNTRS